MTYEEFKNEVKNNIKNYLSEEYKDYNMKFQTIQKSSRYEYDAIMISMKKWIRSSKSSPTVIRPRV